MKYCLLILTFIGSTNLFGQITFESEMANFKVDVPVEPTEQLDTIQTDYGLIPHYLMLSKSIDHGRNLLYSVEIMDIKEVNSDLTYEDLKDNYISRKESKSGNISFELVRESEQDIPEPYDVELVFLDRNGFLMFSRIFQRDSKFYILETLRIKSSFKVGSKLNKATSEFFESFELIK